jgi:hypothetical protein
VRIYLFFREFIYFGRANIVFFREFISFSVNLFKFPCKNFIPFFF